MVISNVKAFTLVNCWSGMMLASLVQSFGVALPTMYRFSGTSASVRVYVPVMKSTTILYNPLVSGLLKLWGASGRNGPDHLPSSEVLSSEAYLAQLPASGINRYSLRSEEHTSELQSRENIVC